jgi:predicted ATPase/DNA-binding SARP family transcriptional activator
MTRTAFDSYSDRLHLNLFGQLRIKRGITPIRLPTRKLDSLLAYLVLHPGAHGREKLASLFWGDVPDEQARASLRNALAILRKRLGRDLLIADRELVQLNPTYPLWVDALEFEAQANRCHTATSFDPDAISIDTYNGDLLEDYYDDWILADRERFHNLYLETLLLLTHQLRANSDYERAIQFAKQVLACDAANERGHQHLMFCYVALGNRSAAIRQFEACVRALREELAVEPSPETKVLYEWILQAPSERKPLEASITNLPIPLTSFIGRQSEMAGIKNLLSTVRLITLTGAGGSGKTRLAIQVGIDLLDAYKDGVWWVDLAALTDGALVLRTVAKVLGAAMVPNQPPNETLMKFLKPRQLLLVLDNCEHLSAACAYLAESLLSTCPDLKIMATSREALGLTGEHVWYVATLSVPEVEQANKAAEMMRYESVRLFIGRAAAVNSRFALTDETASPVAQICQRLDGMPLALELAAARAKVLPVEQIAARLGDRFNLLSTGSRTALPRHQTLRAAIDWSYDLLPEEEQNLFRRLSAFAGSFTLSAAEAVCSADGIEADEVFSLLSNLVDKSLLEMQEQGGEARYRMLQTIRQYAHERLIESGEYSQVHDRHLDYFLHQIRTVNPHLGYFLPAADMQAWLGVFELDNDNLRAALNWCLEKEERVEQGLQMAGYLHWFWYVRGHFSKGRIWISRLLELSSDVPQETRALALLTLGFLSCWQGDFTAGQASLEMSLSLFRWLEDGHGIAFALHGLGFVAMGGGKLDLSRSLFEEAVREAREWDNKWLLSFSLHFLAIVLTYQEAYDSASRCFEESNALMLITGGDQSGTAFSLFHLGRIARLKGDYPGSKLRHSEGLQFFKQIGDRRGIGFSLAGLAVLAAAQDHLQHAARLSGAVASLQDELGSFLEVPLQIEYDQEMSAVRSTLSEEAYDSAWAEGHTMKLQQAIEYAVLSDSAGSSSENST